MSSRELPVVAVIPNYNMAAELGRLLPQMLEQGYRDIFVLDDASTDNSQAVVKQFAPGVTWVAGKQNVGAGGNRNRIMQALNYHALIHFIDADTNLGTNHTADIVRQVAAAAQPFGFIGGLVVEVNGLQNPWNYGPRQGLYNDVAANLQVVVGFLALHCPRLAWQVARPFRRILASWPDLLGTPHRREVFWAIESNLVIDSAVFARFGGFDPSLREHEIQDLAVRMARAGLKRYFDPRLKVQHTKGNVRHYNRTLARLRAEYRLAWRYGFSEWLRPGR